MSFDIASILHHHRLTSHFGRWPSFHDAEVIDLHLWRGQIAPGDWNESNCLPVTNASILVLRATQIDWRGPDVLATLRFHDVDSFRLDGFDSINQIVDLTISTEARGHFSSGEALPPHHIVSFERGVGLAAQFRCLRIEVVAAEPVVEGHLPRLPYP
ncbi:MAG: hypothetical protein ACT6XY_01335 [Phreatobacter sp.]|jgi:hypothetical protein|uniref:hypothetical protein n=1 Tax=Phreatobacter sp. TaxID=1966341 RepID=UPI0040359031